eukprot:6195784-Pleurochrysis_carterae.AAC.5
MLKETERRVSANLDMYLMPSFAAQASSGFDTEDESVCVSGHSAAAGLVRPLPTSGAARCVADSPSRLRARGLQP